MFEGISQGKRHSDAASCHHCATVARPRGVLRFSKQNIPSLPCQCSLSSTPVWHRHQVCDGETWLSDQLLLSQLLNSFQKTVFASVPPGVPCGTPGTPRSLGCCPHSASAVRLPTGLCERLGNTRSSLPHRFTCRWSPRSWWRKNSGDW